MLAATAPNRNNHSPRAAEQYARSALALLALPQRPSASADQSQAPIHLRIWDWTLKSKRRVNNGEDIMNSNIATAAVYVETTLEEA